MPRPMSRREMLGRCATGFGAVALSSLLADPAYGKAKSPFAPRKPHHDAKAKSVIFLYMDGGVSQVCLLYTSPSPRDLSTSRMPSSA